MVTEEAIREVPEGAEQAVEEGEEEEETFEPVDRLQAHGINAGDIKKLVEAGIVSCNGVRMQTKKTLCNIKGLSEAKVDKILEAVDKIINGGFVTGSEALNKRKQVIKITTGSATLDELLGGGMETASITEAFGEFRTGKTQIAHTLCVTTQLPRSMNGGHGKVAYIDTEGTFRPERIIPIAERFGMDPNSVLENQKLGQMLSRLTKIAEEFNVAVYLTNQVIADPGGGATFVADPKKPAGGHVMAHASTHRLMMRKGKGDQRICKIYDSPSLPESECTFQISAGGVQDAKD